MTLWLVIALVIHQPKFTLGLGDDFMQSLFGDGRQHFFIFLQCRCSSDGFGL